MDSRFSRAALAAFELLFTPWRRRRLRAVLLTGLPEGLPAGRPLLLAANHVSWWDAFLLREVHRALRPAAPLYTVMRLRELERIPFFRWTGAVGIEPAFPATVLAALRFLRERVQERPDSVVLFFPQGRIWPSHRRPLGFRRGVELFARRLAPVVLPVAIHLEPLSTAAPTAFLSVGEPVEGAPDAREMEARVEAELDALLAFLARHGEDAPRAWPEPRGRLDPVPAPAGRAG